RQAVGVLLVFAVGMGVIGILGLRFSDKFLPIPIITALLPRIDFSIFNPRGFTPNIVAGAVAPAIPICWAWAGNQLASRRERVFIASLSLLLCLTVVLTQSRGAMLGLGVALVVLIL